MMDSYIAAIAFDHLAIFAKRRNTIRTCHRAAVAANTVGGIINCKIRFWVFFRQALGHALMHGASLQCIHAKDK